MNYPDDAVFDNYPDWGRFFDSLRGSGYSLNAAIADIIDNSISAGASIVNVKYELNFADSSSPGSARIAIIDNGHGMDRDGVLNALKYGAAPRAEAKSLGKFGIGLKLASTAFAKVVTVTSRKSGVSQPVTGILDLDFITSKAAPVIPIIEAQPEALDLIDEIAPNGSGTVVDWTVMDRLRLNQYQRRAPQINAYDQQIAELDAHIGMIFQRYLSADAGAGARVEIFLNDRAVAPWDPFCVDVVGSPMFEKEIVADDGTVLMRLRGFVLPRIDGFPSAERFAEANISLNYQGVYVYREDRLIEGPVWLDKTARDLHYNGARIDASFTHEADDLLGLSYRKDSITGGSEIQEEIRNFSTMVRRAANEEHRARNTKSAVSAAASLHSVSSAEVEKNIPQLETVNVTESNADRGEVRIDAGQGEEPRRLQIAFPSDPGIGNFNVESSLEDGVLWSPFYSTNTGHIGVQLNAGHDFYKKAYVANQADTNVIRAIDFLIWSIAQAEADYSARDRAFADTFDDFKVQVSRNLKRLVRDLPEPEENVDSTSGDEG